MDVTSMKFTLVYIVFMVGLTFVMSLIRRRRGGSKSKLAASVAVVVIVTGLPLLYQHGISLGAVDTLTGGIQVIWRVIGQTFHFMGDIASGLG